MPSCGSLTLEIGPSRRHGQAPMLENHSVIKPQDLPNGEIDGRRMLGRTARSHPLGVF